MSSRQPRVPARPRAYRTALLVLAVLAGVLAMHGLAPGTAAHARAHAHGQAHAHGAAHVRGDACAHLDEGGGGSGHAAHADSTCAAGGVPTAPGQAPLLTGGAERDADDRLRARPGAATATDRAPPDLARLQLLRI
ncbi:DUF6153 family protein [Streptomyces sp. NPDC016309]|uniref:DUF6153 family protein n=1 Tax=Streptomyces sp. NPDC016309 TaxID=3364965 RepID=UPI0036FE0FD6